MTVIILSRDATLYSTQVLCEAFREAGHDVRVLDVLQLEVKIGSGVYHQGRVLCPDLVIPRLSAPLLLAGLAVVREWESRGVAVLNSAESLLIAANQLHTLQVLSAESLPIPESSFCSQPSKEETFHSLLGTEAKVIKLLESSQGKGVTLAPDYRTGRSLLTTLASLRSSGLTQRFYPEAEGVDCRLLVLDGVVICAMRRTAQEGDFRANVHQGGSCRAYEPTAEEVTLAVRAAGALGLTLAGVDLLQTKDGPVILELNASPGLEGIEAGQRGSVARLICDHVLKLFSE